MPDPRPDPAETTGLPLPPANGSTGLTVEHTPHARPNRAAEPVPDVPGYAIESVLGRGGMGVVYKARQIAANRPVALKMILGGELAGEQERNRLRTEAESIARLNHPNIVQVYEVGEYRGVPFFSMEYCAGGSLAQNLGGNPMPATTAARLVARLAGALGCAHQAGVIHRDLKPANILIARGDVAAQADTRPEQSTRDTGKSGRSSQAGRQGAGAQADGSGDHGSEPLPKVTDFGLAKHLDAGPGQTRSGQVMGTPSYMAPEQALGDTKHVGPLADVYALGAVLYECLTGRPPFRAATTLETLDQVRHKEPVPVRDLAPAVPRDLETICLKCIQKDPHRRYASADDLGDDLRRFLDGRPIVARPVGPVERAAKWVRRNKAVSAALAVAALALVAGTAVSSWLAVIADEERGFAQQKEALATRREGEARTAEGQARTAESQARDAEGQAEQRRQQAQTALAAEQTALAARTKALSEKDAALTAERTALSRETRTSYARAITLASLEYERNNVPAVRRLLADCPVALRGWEWHYLDRACRAASWEFQAHPPGRTRVRFDAGGGRLVTSGVKNLVKVWDSGTRAHVADLAGHDGQAFALAAGPGAGFVVSGEIGVVGKDGGRVIVWDLARKESVAMVAGTGRWGAWVYGLASSPDGKRVAIGGTAGKVFLWDVRGDGSVKSWDVDAKAVPAVAFTADGENVLVAAGKKVHVFAADTGASRAEFASSSEGVETIAAAPNARWFAVGHNNGLIRVYDIITRAPVATLSGHTAQIEDLAFSPDGRWVASASADGSARVWDVVTGNQVFHLRGHAGPVSAVAFRPNGYELVTAGLDGTVRGWDLVLGNEPRSLFQTDSVTAIAGAPGHRRLAWATDNPVLGRAAYHVTVYDFDKGAPILNVPKLTGRVQGLTFSADGRQVAIGQMNGDVLVFDLEGTAPGQRFKTGIFSVSSLAFSPDGNTLACGGALPRAMLIELPGKKLKAQLTGHKGSNTAVAYRPGGAEIATAGFDGTVRVWKADDGAQVRVLTGHDGPVNSVAYRPDGKTLASCGSDGKIRLWDADTGAPVRALEGHAGQVLQVLFTPDGTRLFTVGSDQTLRCWDPDHGDSLLRVAGILGNLDRLTWVGGDGCLASGAGGRSLLLWQKAPFAVDESLAGEKRRMWHNYAWGEAMLARNWFTMEHHLNWLIPQFGDNHPGLYDQRGRARLALGRVAEAVADYSAAVEKGYTDPRALLHLSDAHVLTREYKKAAADLERFAERRPLDPDGMYRRGVLAAYTGAAADARTHQRALRRAAVAGDDGEVKLFSLWLDGVVPDPAADTDTRLAEAAKLVAQNPRQGFHGAVHALWLYRAGKFAEAAAEAQRVANGDRNEGKSAATAVYAMATRKLGRDGAAKQVRDELEVTRKVLLESRPDEWVALGEPGEWPTYLGFLMLTDEYDRTGRPVAPPLPRAEP